MDLFVGKAPPALKDVRIGWGTELPSRVEATLPDGARLRAQVVAPEAGIEIPERGFIPPASDGFRSLTLEEARDLLGRF